MHISNDLITACIANNRTAQKQLYEQLLPYLSAIAKRYLRDNSYLKDVLQESFIKIFFHIARYDYSKASFQTWAAKIVINTSINYNQRTIIGTQEDIADLQNEIHIPPAVLQSLSDEHLLYMLKQMPIGYFEIFNMFVIDEYKHEEIAQILGISEELSRKRLSRAKNWLKLHLQDKPTTKNEINLLQFILN